ncbi:MAG: hypothetical protein JWN78_1210 [Bacteroidota bacterium]|nr:hypothetical protein [Bacteroidota bacterium]
MNIAKYRQGLSLGRDDSYYLKFFHIMLSIGFVER